MKEVVTFMGEIGYSTQSRYGIDYTLGDKVIVQNGYGVNMSAYVTEVTEVQAEMPPIFCSLIFTNYLQLNLQKGIDSIT